MTKVDSIKCPKCNCDSEGMIEKWRLEGSYVCISCGQIFDLKKPAEDDKQNVKS